MLHFYQTCQLSLDFIDIKCVIKSIMLGNARQR